MPDQHVHGLDHSTVDTGLKSQITMPTSINQALARRSGGNFAIRRQRISQIHEGQQIKRLRRQEQACEVTHSLRAAALIANLLPHNVEIIFP